MISIGLNLILGMLLTCALILGVRLERRLRGLRQSHTDFAKAVNELDGAAARTETSLRDLRAGTENAKTEIASRIDQARIACQRLEKLTADAERLASQPLPLAHPVALAQPMQRQAAPLAQAQPGMSAFARPEPEMMRPAAPVQTRPAPMAPAAAQVRSRARSLDDDLFSSSAPPPPRQAPREAFAVEPAYEAEPAYAQPVYAEPAFVEPRAIEPRFAETRAPEPRAPEPRTPEPRRPEARMPEPQWADPTVVPFKADNDPLVGAPKMDRAAREAFYREVLEREASAPDPFEADSRFAYERRAMLAAVMGGRR